ncbi:WXG100 family type VII secretion target [Nocardia arthritidis]|uniref:ESAT-6-like protein n=1 Tax=Nocardia arthritidis TaxID=228602 RepID=A0A6G9Y7F6_9NOCA|nr:WXG100 family type VII secretion target [Nocardia arthritidis]QIS09006.1 WXG100 family type VII secretion target [Nocardia arthritidis]
MAGVSHNHEALVAGKLMLDSVTNMKTILTRLQDAVDAARPGWKGQAAIAFNNAADNWDKKAEEMRQKLDRISEQVVNGSHQYGNMDEVSETELQQVGGGLLNL